LRDLYYRDPLWQRNLLFLHELSLCPEAQLVEIEPPTFQCEGICV